MKCLLDTCDIRASVWTLEKLSAWSGSSTEWNAFSWHSASQLPAKNSALISVN